MKMDATEYIVICESKHTGKRHVQSVSLYNLIMELSFLIGAGYIIRTIVRARDIEEVNNSLDRVRDMEEVNDSLDRARGLLEGMKAAMVLLGILETDDIASL